MKSRLVLVMLTILILVMMFPHVFAEETIGSGTNKIYNYEYYADGTAIVTAYLGEDTDLTIPVVIGDHPVISIGEGMFEDNGTLNSVTISDGILAIGDYAFFWCHTLQSVTIPDSVTTIGKYAFADCPSLTSVILPAGLECIDVGTFAECESLTSIFIPGSVTYIHDTAFSGCPNLFFNVAADSYAEQFCLDHDLAYQYWE